MKVRVLRDLRDSQGKRVREVNKDSLAPTDQPVQEHAEHLHCWALWFGCCYNIMVKTYDVVSYCSRSQQQSIT